MLEGTRWFPLNSLPDLSPSDTGIHFISYNQAGTAANFHSDSKPVERIITWDEVSHVRGDRPLDLAYFADLLTAVREEAGILGPQQPDLFRTSDDTGVRRLAAIVEEIADLLRRPPRIEWLIVPEFAELPNVVPVSGSVS